MQGAFSLVLLYLVGITYGSIAGDDSPQTIEEKAEYYPNQATFGRLQDPAYKQYQNPAFGQPQAYAQNRPQAYPNDRPQAQAYNRLQESQYDQPQAPSYTRPEAYDRFQPQPYEQSKLAEYQRQYLNYAQKQRDQEQQQMAYYKELEKERAEADAKAAATPAPTKPPAAPTPRTTCPGNCPKWCVPRCNVECCNPKPPPMPEYLQRQQLTASACEGHKLKIKCPNRSDRIIMYSSFYGREKDGNSTCHHDVLPAKGTCNDQEHHVNEKVYNLCGHENRCEVAVNNKFLAKDNTTICPGVYKYLKVIYKCSQHPKIFKICPLPCKKPENCFPSCSKKCCSPHPPAPSKEVAAEPPPASKTCPAPCPSTCKPPCTPQCCYKDLDRETIKSYLYGNKPGQKPDPDDPNTYGAQYAQQNYNSNPYYQQPQQNLLNDYNADQQSSCPAECSQTCGLNCPQECCSKAGQQYADQQYTGQAVNYYG